MADYIEVGKKTIIDDFNIALGEVVLKFNRLFKPYDMPCAKLEFKDKIETAERESERIFGFVKPIEKIDFGDLNKFGDADRFELLEDKEETEFVIINGIRTSTVAGHTLTYQCKARKHKIAVFIPIKEYQEMKRGK